MLRKCSHCGSNGHNSRTCLDSKGGFKLFGVRVSADCCTPASQSAAAPSECPSTSLTAMRKSASMGNLCTYGSAEGGSSPLSPSHFEQADVGDPVEGYASDDVVHTNSSSRERKKGVPWVEEEHRAFLLGLQKLGKGDWRGIARNFVKTRTPTQVASHAQKYFLRRNNLNKRRRRSSLFDITGDAGLSLCGEPVLEETGFGDDPDACPELSLGQSIPHGPPHGVDASRFARHGYPVEYLPMPSHQFPLMCPPTAISYPKAGLVDEVAKSNHKGAKDVLGNGHIEQAVDDTEEMEVVPEAICREQRGHIASRSEVQLPLTPVLAPSWPGQSLYSLTNKFKLGRTECKIVKPTPMIPRPPRNVEDAVKISKPARNGRFMEPSPLSYRLLEEGSRHSAFHMTPASNGGSREVDGRSSVSNAISVTREEIFSSVCDCMAA